MKYQNPSIEEGHNYSKEHPLKEFWQLLAGIVITIIVVVLLLNVLSGVLAKQVPFEYEQKLASTLTPDLILGELVEQPSDVVKTQEEVVDRIAKQLLSVMDLPAEIQVQIHYSGGETVNALAFLGGHVYLFEGLIERLQTEQELAAVMAHEIAHIKLRHPITALGKGVGLAVLAASVAGASGSAAGEFLFGSSASLTMLKFSRDQESAADLEAAIALERLYGDIGGFSGLFKTFATLEGEHGSNYGQMELFSSHPYSEKRWQYLQAQAEKNNWRVSGSETALVFSK